MLPPKLHCMLSELKAKMKSAMALYGDNLFPLQISGHRVYQICEIYGECIGDDMDDDDDCHNSIMNCFFRLYVIFDFKNSVLKYSQ